MCLGVMIYNFVNGNLLVGLCLLSVSECLLSQMQYICIQLYCEDMHAYNRTCDMFLLILT